MKKNLLILSFLFLSQMVGATTLRFSPVLSSVLVGDSLDVDVVISGLGNGSAPSISTFDLDIGFDDNQLSFASAVFGESTAFGLLSFLDTFGFASNPIFAGITSPGALNLFELSLDLASDLDGFQPDSFTLATLTFNVLSAKTKTLDIFINDLGDANGNPLIANVESATISSVPLPAAIWFFLTGLAALGFRKVKSRTEV